MRGRVLPLLSLLLLLTSLGGCLDAVEPDEPAPVADAVLGDPLATGPLASTLHDWDLGTVTVAGDANTYVVRLHGELHLPEGDGAHPVVVIQHGRHSTCRVEPVGFEYLVPGCPDAEDAGAPGPAPVAPVDSYTGYRYLGEHLASHGLVVVTVSANDVNDVDNQEATFGGDYGATARGRIVLRVLEAVQEAGAGDADDGSGLGVLEGRVDTTHVGLMGHSRGGEGVARAWVLSREGELRDGIRVEGVFALAPTDFQRWDVRGVPFGTLLPYCDGDVSNLQGARMYDDARRDNDAPIHQFLALGANHNYYNTVWTGSDWTNRGDPWCDLDSDESGRDDPEAQRLHGLAVMGAFLRHYVGGEADQRPFLTGEAAWPVPKLVTSYQPGDARPFLGDDHETGTTVIKGAVDTEECAGTACPAKSTYTVASQTAIQWTGPGAYRVGVVPTGDHVTFRVGVDPETVTQEELDGIRVVVRGPDHETSTPLSNLGAFVPPGKDGAKTVLNTVRVPVPEGTFEVALRFTVGTGVVQVNDWLQA